MRSVIERYRRPPSPFLEENQQHIPSEFFFFFHLLRGFSLILSNQQKTLSSSFHVIRSS